MKPSICYNMTKIRLKLIQCFQPSRTAKYLKDLIFKKMSNNQIKQKRLNKFNLNPLICNQISTRNHSGTTGKQEYPELPSTNREVKTKFFKKSKSKSRSSAISSQQSLILREAFRSQGCMRFIYQTLKPSTSNSTLLTRRELLTDLKAPNGTTTFLITKS